MKKYKTNPKWKMKCFGCRCLLNKYPEYYKDWSGAYCLDCGEERMANINYAEIDAIKEEEAWKPYNEAYKQWVANGKKGPPPRTPEEKRIDEVNLLRYGEY